MYGTYEGDNFIIITDEEYWKAVGRSTYFN